MKVPKRTHFLSKKLHTFPSERQVATLYTFHAYPPPLIFLSCFFGIPCFFPFLPKDFWVHLGVESVYKRGGGNKLTPQGGTYPFPPLKNALWAKRGRGGYIVWSWLLHQSSRVNGVEWTGVSCWVCYRPGGALYICRAHKSHFTLVLVTDLLVQKQPQKFTIVDGKDTLLIRKHFLNVSDIKTDVV